MEGWHYQMNSVERISGQVSRSGVADEEDGRRLEAERGKQGGS